MTSTTNYLNYSIIAAAFIAMVIRKYNYSYMFFSFLIGWNILTNFVSGDIKNSITNAKLPYIIFSIILFFTLLYLTVITVKNADLFDKSLGGDLEFYLNTSNILVLFVTILIISNEELTKTEFIKTWEKKWGFKPSFLNILANDLTNFANKLPLKQSTLNYITRKTGHDWISGKIFITNDGYNKRNQVINKIENKSLIKVYLE